MRLESIHDSSYRPAGVDPATHRDKVRSSLMEAGVISMIYYPLPLHLQEVYRDLGTLRAVSPSPSKSA